MDDLEPGVLGTSENSQRRVLPNRGKAVGCCYSRSGQEGCITSQRCYGMTNRAERYPISHSVPLLSISTPRWLSLSSHHPKNIFYTHAWCSCLPCSPLPPPPPPPAEPTRPVQQLSLHRAIPPTSITAPLLPRKHLCSTHDPLPPHFQSTGKASSLFVCADVSRRQVAGLQADGLSPSSHLLPFFPGMLPARLHLQQSRGTCWNTSLPAPGTASPVTNKQAPASHGAAHQTPFL